MKHIVKLSVHIMLIFVFIAIFMSNNRYLVGRTKRDVEGESRGVRGMTDNLRKGNIRRN